MSKVLTKVKKIETIRETVYNFTECMTVELIMKVTRKTVTHCKKADNDKKYIIYIPGNSEDINTHSS
ncbi:MAG: hypothetical protein PV340_02600 [Wolbachia sp.]|nr:hypothetical protein [Wolbachia sp.]MDD9335965.1 hypothetical protein [Wolbachia sp.]